MEGDGDFKKASRRALFGKDARQSATDNSERHVRTKVTMNIDGDVVAYFKERARAECMPYQLLINQALREYMEGSVPEKLARRVSEVLLESPSFVEALAERLSLPETKEES